MSLKMALDEPIDGSNPGGENLRYDPVYEQIKQARIEEVDAPQGDWQRARRVADWDLVTRLAAEVLEKRSKDLQIAAWLTEAKLRKSGFTGLREGLELMIALVDRFWEHLYPEIEEDDLELRAAPLAWVGTYLDTSVRLVPLNREGHDLSSYLDSRRVGYEESVADDWDAQKARQELIEEGKLTPEEFDAAVRDTPKAWYKQLVSDIDGSLAAIDALERLCDEKLGSDAPSFQKIRGAVQEVRPVAAQLLARKLELEPDPPGEEAAAPETVVLAGGAPPMGPAADATAGAVSAIPRTRDEAAARIAAAARFMRTAAPSEPASYLMLRGFRWGELRGDGAGIDPRLLLAPPTEVRARLKALLLDESWEQLLDAAEDVMATPYGRGWLDLQRYAITAMDAIGHEHVSHAVRGALRSLLHDLPRLPDSMLMDDSPAANAETRAWLAQQRLLEPVDGAVAPEMPAATVRRRDALDRANDLVRAGQPNRAIDVLMLEAEQENSQRARFLRRTQAAAVMVDAGMEQVAMPILEELANLVEKHSLEEWESGRTMAQPLGLLYRCLDRLDLDSDTKESLYVRVCRLDPLLAIKLSNNRRSTDDGDAGEY